ncbi:MAG: type II toxin-antitoxin system HicA family toxin [Actinomycetota bacterium]|nr:type II toxin-antitoxin system HicA family toxin [Actinomycetota bacterium]
MPKVPPLTPKDVIKILEHHGFILDHSSGSHKIYYHPDAKKRAVVPYHRKDLPKGTAISILKQAGINIDALRR